MSYSIIMLVDWKVIINSYEPYIPLYCEHHWEPLAVLIVEMSITQGYSYVQNYHN